MNILQWLQNWYFQQCDDNWEHNYGIKIDTLDNPGWSVEIDLTDTDLEFEPFERVEVEYSEQDLIHCRVQDRVFRGAGGPNNLQDILEIFYKWVSHLEPRSQDRG
ncbi:immunity 53 family protein [Candidatus Poribacteria bacterium]|nr:immunity 53 family protein [Candidatus Poribacteria bacterium]